MWKGCLHLKKKKKKKKGRRKTVPISSISNFPFSILSLNYSLGNRRGGRLRKVNRKSTRIRNIGQRTKMFAFRDTRKLNIIVDANERSLIIRTTNYGIPVFQPVFDIFFCGYWTIPTRTNLRSAEEITGNTDGEGCSLLGDEWKLSRRSN